MLVGWTGQGSVIIIILCSSSALRRTQQRSTSRRNIDRQDSFSAFSPPIVHYGMLPLGPPSPGPSLHAKCKDRLWRPGKCLSITLISLRTLHTPWSEQAGISGSFLVPSTSNLASRNKQRIAGDGQRLSFAPQSCPLVFRSRCALAHSHDLDSTIANYIAAAAMESRKGAHLFRLTRDPRSPPLCCDYLPCTVNVQMLTAAAAS